MTNKKFLLLLPVIGISFTVFYFGVFITDTPENNTFDSHECPISTPRITIVGFDGFQKTTLPNTTNISYDGPSGKFPPDEFLITPGNSASIIKIYDFDPNNESECDLTINNVLGKAKHTTVKQFFGEPISVSKLIPDEPSTFEPVDSINENFQIRVSSIKNLTNYEVEVTYNITTSESALGNSYLARIGLHCPGTLFTIGNDYFSGTLPWDKGVYYGC